MKSVYLIGLFVFLAQFALAQETAQQHENQSVLIAILARNKAHFLDRYLNCISNLDYPKHLITLYINTNNNVDETEAMLTEWVNLHRSEYHNILLDMHEIPQLSDTLPHDWTKERFKVLGSIRNKSIQVAKEHACDYYFVVDCDNFIVPSTLKTLIACDKPIVAPMLKAIPEPGDPYSNFFCDISETGYYKEHPQYREILTHSVTGVFKVPVVHCTYLIKKEHFDDLSYIDETDDYEFVIFSRSARNHGIDQYICNIRPFGHLYHTYESLSLTAEKQKAQTTTSFLESTGLYENHFTCVEKGQVLHKFVKTGCIWIDDFLANDFQNWENDTFEAFEKVKDPEGIAIDIGAWLGTTAIWLSKNFLHVIAVEGDKESLRYLEKNLKGSGCANVTICDKPVTGDGQRALFGPRLSMKHGEALNGSTSYVKASSNSLCDYLTPSATFKQIVDDYVFKNDSINKSSISFIKCDIEGGEENILQDILEFCYENKCKAWISFHLPWWTSKKITEFERLFEKFNTSCPTDSICDYITQNPFASIFFEPKSPIDSNKPVNSP